MERHVTVGDVLRRAVARVPDRTALVDANEPGGPRWTYAELLADSERVARALLERFTPGEPVACCAPNRPELVLEGLFFHLGADPASALPRDLGCELDDDSFIRTDEGETSVSGVYAAGDITGLPHLAIAAAADGVRAALKIHRSLLDEKLRL